MKRILVFLTLAFFSLSTMAWEKKEESKVFTPDETEVVEVIGGIDIETVTNVQRAIKNVSEKDSTKKVLRVKLTSPGGSAIAGYLAARLLRKLSDEGKVKVETYAEGLCASACTFILASGTPGYRTIDQYTFFLVHPVQSGSMFGMSCIEHKEKADDQESKAGNVILEIGRDLLMKFTGKDQKTVEMWMSCGHEQVGQGQLALELGFADKVLK